MDEATALVAWGRQVLANRRLQKQRTRLEREQQNQQNECSGQLMKPGAANRSNTSWSSIHREVGEQPFVDKSAFIQRSAVKGPTSPRTPAPQTPMRRNSIEDTVEVAQIRRRVDTARQTLSALLLLEKRNAGRLQHRREELQRVLEQTRHRTHPHYTKQHERHHYSQPHHQEEEERQCFVAAPAESGAVDSEMARATTIGSPVPLERLTPVQPKQMEEFFASQKVLLKRLKDEKVEGAAVAAFTACASGVRGWDDRVFQPLREAFHDWRLHLIPTLYRFSEVVHKLLVLPKPMEERQEQQQQQQEGSKISPQRLSDNRTKSENNTTEAVGGGLPYSELFALKEDVVFPVLDSYPTLNAIDTRPVKEAIGLTIHALVKAGRETTTCLSSLMELSDQQDARLSDLLTLSENQLRDQKDTLREAYNTLEKLHDEKSKLEMKGIELTEDVGELQQKVLTLKIQHDQHLREERESMNVLQGIQARISEMKHELEREASFKTECLDRTAEAKDEAERARHQKTVLEINIQEVGKQEKMLESDLVALRRAARIAKEEEEKAAELRQEHFNEFCVHQTSLHTARKSLLNLRQQQEEAQNELISLRCRVQELESQIADEELACGRVIAEINVERAVEATVRDELAGVHAEEAQLRTETAALRMSIRRAEAEQTKAEATLLFHRQEAGVEAPTTTAGPPTQRSLAEVLLEANNEGTTRPEALETSRASAKEVAVVETCDVEKGRQRPACNNTRAKLQTPSRTYREVAELRPIQRSVRREQEDLSVVQSHFLRERQQKGHREGETWEIVEKVSEGRSIGPDILEHNGHKSFDSCHQTFPLVVARPSRHEMRLNYADNTSRLYHIGADLHDDPIRWVG